jgi:hypothetical protein
MIVGYPGSLKSTIVSTAIEPYPDAMVISDMNVQQFLRMQEDFVTGRFSCLAFTDYEKLYQRHSSTASHIEGIIKGLVAEGYGTGPSGDQRMPTIPARSLVIGAMTRTCFEERYANWQKSGFLRRFLWIVIALQNPGQISKAINRWEKLDLGKLTFRPANKTIRVENSPERTEIIERMMKYQPGADGTAKVLLKKIVAVLEWKHNNGTNGGRKKVTEILEDVASGLGKGGGRIIL